MLSVERDDLAAVGYDGLVSQVSFFGPTIYWTNWDPIGSRQGARWS